jgi:MoaA/NifB/PqqE/SkfB family radical SAM enzyme
MKKSSIQSAVLAITYKCNLKCKMCNIWQDPNPSDISLDYLDNLKDLKYINLSGGEPFLKENFVDLIKKLKENNPQSNIIISTNGYARDLIMRSVKKIITIDPNIGIRVSLDGIGDLHNKIRGLDNAYEMAIKTIEGLQKIGIENLGVAFTLMPENKNEIKKVYKLSKELDIQFSISSVQNSDIYFNKDNNNLSFDSQIDKDLNYIIKKELKSWNFKRWLRAYFIFGLKYYIETKKRLIPSDTGEFSVFIDVEGEIYPSNLVSKKLGNIKDTNLNDLKYKNQATNDHWTVCTIRGAMKKYWYKVIFWVLKNKIKTLF